MESSEEVYEKFMGFCSVSLKGENPKFLDLIKSRYEGCDDDFRTSKKMVQLLEKTQKNMSYEASRKFVHLKYLLTELKINSSAKRKNKVKKRKHSSDSEAETEHAEKVPKLKDCSVVVEKVPHSDTSLLDQNIVQDVRESDDQSQLCIRKACSITDGNCNSALCIAVAHDEQMDNFRKEHGSGLELFSRPPVSPICNWGSSSSERVDIDKIALTHCQGDKCDFDSTSPHSPHITAADSNRVMSNRKSVSVVGIDSIAKEGCIRPGALENSPSACTLFSKCNSNDQESQSLQAESASCQINNTELKTALTVESTLNSIITETVSPRKKSTSIVDVELSISPDMLIIESSSLYKRHLKETLSNKSDNSKTLQLDCAQSAIAMFSAQTCKENPCLEIDSSHSVKSSTISDGLNASSSTNNEEITACTLPDNVHEKLSFQEPLVEPYSSLSPYNSACVSTNATSLKSPQDKSNHVNYGCINYEEIISDEEESAHEESAVSQRQDTFIFETRSSVDNKLPKRVPLLPSTKTDASISSSLFCVKPYSHGSHKKAAKEPKSFTAGCKSASFLMEDKTLDSGMSADEFQREDREKNVSTDEHKLKQRRVIKLERLLGSLRSEIEKCQDTEMTLEDLDDENAAYIYEDKLKRKFVAAWNKLCEVTDRSVTTGRPTERTIRYSGTRYGEINRRIQKFLNKKKVFPDFHDIKSIVKLTNKKCDLNLSTMMINDIAREAFVDIGEMLQTRRHQDFIASFGTRQTDVLRNSMDPYLADPELRKKVDSNRQVAKLNLDSVIAKYTRLQYDRNYEDDEVEDEDEVDIKIGKNNAGTKEKSKKEAVSKEMEDFVTSASIEVDMAEEDDDTSQQSATRYNPTFVHLGRSTYLLTPEKKSTASGSNIPSTDQSDVEAQVSEGEGECYRPQASSIIIIEASPAKCQTEPWKIESFKMSRNSHYLDLQRINREASQSQPVKANHLLDAESERKRSNIKYTARKPLSSSEFIPKNSSDTLSYNLENSKINENSDEENDDQSSDSTSEKDVDDKNVDDDVEEIVMIINRSESECDTASSRGISPISVVSLSSDSLTENDDMQVEEIITAVKVCTNDKQSISSSNISSKHCPRQIEHSNLEKQIFLHAMGMQGKEIESSSSVGWTEGTIGIVEKNGNPILDDVKETEDKYMSNQTPAMFSAGVDQQQERFTTDNVCLIAEDCHLPQNIQMTQNDCIILGSTHTQSIHLTEASAQAGKVSEDNVISVQAFNEITAASGTQTEIFQPERDCLQSPTKKCTCVEPNENTIKNAENATRSCRSCAHSVWTDQQMKETVDVSQKMLSDIANKEVIANTEKVASEIGSTACPQTAIEDSAVTGEFKDITCDSDLPKMFSCVVLASKLQAVSTYELKKEEVAPEKSTEDKTKSAKPSSIESFGAVKRYSSMGSENSKIENKIESELLNNSLKTVVENLKACPVTPKTCQNNTEPACEKISTTNNEGTCNINSGGGIECYSDVINEPRIDSAKSSCKFLKDRVMNEVIILDDSSVDLSCSQDSPVFSQRSELPWFRENSSNGEKHSTCNSDEGIKKDFHASSGKNGNDGKCQDSYQEMADVPKDVQDSHKNGQKISFLVTLSEINDQPKEIFKLDETASRISITTDLELKKREPDQQLSELYVKHAHKTNISNSQDLIGSTSELGELVSNIVREEPTTESYDKYKENVAGLCENINTTAMYSKNTETKRTTNKTEQEVNIRVKSTNEKTVETLGEQINNHSSRTAANMIEHQNTIKQAQENHSPNLFDDSSVFTVFTDTDNVIIKDNKEVAASTVNLTLHSESVHTNVLCQENVASVYSNQKDEHFSYIIGSKVKKLFVGNGQDAIHSAVSNSGMRMAVTDAVDNTVFSSIVEEPIYHSPKDEGSTNTNVCEVNSETTTAENANEVIKKQGLFDKIDKTSVVASNEHNVNSCEDDRYVSSDNVKTDLRASANDGVSILCNSDCQHALHSRDMETLTGADDKIITKFDNEIQTFVDENYTETRNDPMVIDVVEEQSLEQNGKFSKLGLNSIERAEDDGDESVDLLSSNSHNSETNLEDCGSISHRCNSDSDTSSSKPETQTHEDLNVSTQKTSLVSGPHSNVPQDSVTTEMEENYFVIKNVISLREGGENVADNAIVNEILPGYKEGAVKDVDGQVRQKVLNDCNKESKLANFSDAASIGLVSEMYAVNRRKNGEVVSAKKFTESSSGTDAELASLDDEDEIKIIEELSSIKGLRTSENSKKDDRKLVDQLLLDIDLTKSEGITFSGSNVISVSASQMSRECWDTCDNAEENGTVEMASEKRDGSLNTNSLCHSSVLSVECEEINPSEEKLSSPAPQSHTTSPVNFQAGVKNSKRSYDESVSGRLSSKAVELDSEVENAGENKTACNPVIEVDILPQPKKQKVIKADFITDIISGVMSEFPSTGKISKTSTFVAKNNPHVTGTTGEETIFSLSKSSDQVGGDDEDVVIMEESPPSSSNHYNVIPVALRDSKTLSCKTSAGFKRQTSPYSYASVGKTSCVTSRPVPFKKHQILQASLSNPDQMFPNAPSFQFQHSQAQSISNHTKRSPVSSKNNSPLFVRAGKNPLASTLIGSRTNKILPHGKANASQSLPRLMPRVPIPSIQPNGSNEFNTSYPKHCAVDATANRFSTKRSQLSASDRISSSDIRCRPQMSNTPLFKNRSLALARFPSDNRGRSGLAPHRAGRFNYYPKQSLSETAHNTEKHKPQLSPSHGLQTASVQCGTRVNTTRGRSNQQRMLDGTEITLGDSDDDDGECDNTYSGLRIVSVASLSPTQCNLNTLHGDYNVPNTSVQDQSHKKSRDVIVIPD